MDSSTPEVNLDHLVVAMAHWLEAAQEAQLDPDSARRRSRELDEARRRLTAHQRLSRPDKAGAPR
jgi:hypothetical protein